MINPIQKQPIEKANVFRSPYQRIPISDPAVQQLKMKTIPSKSAVYFGISYLFFLKKTRELIEKGNPPPSLTQNLINCFSSGFISGGILSPFYQISTKVSFNDLLNRNTMNLIYKSTSKEMTTSMGIKGGVLALTIEGFKYFYDHPKS